METGIRRNSSTPLRLVGFDGEFAIKEIIELSVYSMEYTSADASQNNYAEVFHQYFKPRLEQRWPGSERVHHISPAMVRHRPHFLKFRPMVQQLIDEADCLVGFDIKNDVEALKYEGVERLDDKPVIDVRDLHWLCRGKDAGVPLDSRRGLSATAGELGIEFSDSAAHGASYDTQKTMECLNRLLVEFVAKYPAEPAVTSGALTSGESDGRTPDSAEAQTAEEGGDPVAPRELLERYLQVWERERENYYREYAKGWIAIVEANDGYRLKASRMNQPAGDRIVAAIYVNARYRALDELDIRFDKRRHPLDRKLYRLTKADIEWFKAYTNEYDGEERLHNRMQDLRSRQ